MYKQVRKWFETYRGDRIPMWYREDTNDFNTILSIFRDDEYHTKDMDYKMGDVFIDVGAHIGVWSALMENLVENAKVIAIEPMPENVEMLRKNTLGKIFPLAVAEKSSETLEIHYGDDSETGRHHKFIGSVAKRDVHSNRCYSAPTIGLDDILKHIERCRVMKMDCEGMEYLFFKGASKETLAKIDYIIGEYHNWDNDKYWKREHLLALTWGLFDDITVKKEDYGALNPFWFKNKRL